MGRLSLTLVLYLIYPGRRTHKTCKDGWTTLAPTPACQRSLVRARAVCRHRDERGGDCASRSGAFWCRPFALSMGRLCAGWHSSVYARIQGPVLPDYWIAAVFLWIALIVVNVVKIVEELKEGIHTRKDTKYPMSDEATDVGVLIGTFAVLTLIELWR